jgi:urease accessory protein
MHTDARLWQLISPTLPIGSFSYSQGLEWVVDAGWVSDETTATEWIGDGLTHLLVPVDLALLCRLYQSRHAGRDCDFNHWNSLLIAMRGTEESRNEERTIGAALARLLGHLNLGLPVTNDLSYVGAFAAAAVAWGIELRQACAGYAWAWCENQVAAAIKLVPLGHSDGQCILSGLVPEIDGAVARALTLENEEIGFSTPGLEIARSLHETQYSRLFRS